MTEAGETSIEVAHKLCESDGNKGKIPSQTEFVIEILEAITLALVAVATACSGYQAAQWDGHQAELYAESNALYLKANGHNTSDGQEAIYNSNTLNAWLSAEYEILSSWQQFWC